MFNTWELKIFIIITLNYSLIYGKEQTVTETFLFTGQFFLIFTNACGVTEFETPKSKFWWYDMVKATEKPISLFLPC